MTNKTFEITSPTTFLEACYACTNEEKNLLGDIYQHNVLLFHDTFGTQIIFWGIYS